MPDDIPAQGNGNAPQVESSTFQKMPPFWKNLPEAWFLQVEQLFLLNRVTTEETKFRLVVSVLPQEVITEVVDVLRHPPQDNPYSFLKESLLNRLTCSEEKKIELLLQDSEMGTSSPSSYFRQMENLVGQSNVINEKLLRKLWIRKLPEGIKIAITAAGDKNIKELLEIADRIWEVTNPQIASTSTTSMDIVSSTFMKAISELCIEVNALKKDFAGFHRSRSSERSENSGRFRPRSRSRSRSKGRNYSQPKDGICWYHTNFGDKANKCILPCEYKSKNNLNN